MTVHEKYWEDLVQIKFQTYYLDEYLCDSYKKENCLNIITAIASSGSIGAWAVWKELKLIWTLIIVSSQVINAIKIYLPYNKRKRYIGLFSAELTELFNEYDYNWLKITNGELSVRDINRLVYEMRQKTQKIDSKYEYLPRKEKLITKAETRLLQYFKKYL